MDVKKADRWGKVGVLTSVSTPREAQSNWEVSNILEPEISCTRLFGLGFVRWGSPNFLRILFHA